MPKDNNAYDRNSEQIDEFAKQAAEWDQDLKVLEQGGQMAGAMYRGLTSEGVSGWLAAVAVGTAMQAVFLNSNGQEGESG